MRPLLILLGLVLFSNQALGATPDDVARELVKLRIETEELSVDLTAERRRIAEARAFAEADLRSLDLAVAKAEARARALRASMPVERPAAQSDAPSEYGILPLLLDALHGRVHGGLPFRRKARVDALEALRAEVSSGRAAPGRAAVTFSRFLRDERRLAETVGRAREVLPVDGEARMLEVLRLGLVTMLVQLPDGRAGCTVPMASHELTLFDEGPEAAAVRAAFESYHVHPGGGRTEVPAVCLGGNP